MDFVHVFYYEIKCIVSLVLIFQLFYLTRGFDSLLLAYITDFFQRKAQLPVLVNDVKLDVINGTLEIKNIEVLPPYPSNDESNAKYNYNWHNKVIVSVSKLLITFQLYRTIMAMIWTFGTLLSVDSIQIIGIKF